MRCRDWEQALLEFVLALAVNPTTGLQRKLPLGKRLKEVTCPGRSIMFVALICIPISILANSDEFLCVCLCALLTEMSLGYFLCSFSDLRWHRPFGSCVECKAISKRIAKCWIYTDKAVWTYASGGNSRGISLSYSNIFSEKLPSKLDAPALSCICLKIVQTDAHSSNPLLYINIHSIAAVADIELTLHGVSMISCLCIPMYQEVSD